MKALMSDPFSKVDQSFKGPELTSFRKPVGILYHYCSNASFLSIISTQTIGASDVSLSNDTRKGNGSAK